MDGYFNYSSGTYSQTSVGGISPISDSGGSGGAVAFNSILDDPDLDISNNLGASEKRGIRGSEIVKEYKPGDLGIEQLDYNAYALNLISLRENSEELGLVSVNHRYRGHREAGKLNLIIQKVIRACADCFFKLRAADQPLKECEIGSKEGLIIRPDLYIEEDDIELIYYIQEQIAFKEWMLLKDDDNRWF